MYGSLHVKKILFHPTTLFPKYFIGVVCQVNKTNWREISKSTYNELIKLNDNGKH